MTFTNILEPNRKDRNNSVLWKFTVVRGTSLLHLNVKEYGESIQVKHNLFPSAVHSCPLQSLPLTAYFARIQQQRSGCPDLPPPPPSVLVNSHEDLDDPSYTTVREIRVSPITTSPRVKLLRAPDGEIVRFGSRKYQNVLRVDTLSNTVSLPGEGQLINSPNGFHVFSLQLDLRWQMANVPVAIIYS